MAVPFWRQVRAVLWKNWLLKRKAPVSTFFEVAIPVLFIGLLVWIKSICTRIDAPNVAYACGQTAGFEGYYTESIKDYVGNLSGVPLLQCLQPPEGCVEPNYYREQLSSFDERLPPIYVEYGYTQSGKGYPFYGVTVADSSQVYAEANALLERANVSGLANNPSPTLDAITEAYARHHAVLVVCPARPYRPAVVEAARALYDTLLASLTWAGAHERALVWFESQAALEANVTARDYGSEARPVKIGAAIVLNDVALGDGGSRPRWDYSVRVNFTQNFEYQMDAVGCVHANCGFKYSIPPTKFITNPFVRPAKADFLFGYTYSGYATLQKAVDDFILTNASTQGPVTTTISLGLFPEPAFHSDDFLTVIAASLALFFVLAFLYPVSRFIRALVLEKETRIKETMKIMGLSSLAANLSWVATMLLQGALTVLLMTLLGARSVFYYSNPVLVLLFLLAFSLALITFVFLLSTCFNTAKTAATAGTVLFFAAFFPYYALTGASTGTGTKAAACLLAPTCLGLGSDVLAAFEGGLMGLHWDNLWVQPGETNFSYAWAVGMLLADALLYALLAAYLEAVLPSEYGTQLPWYFPLTPEWWRGVLVGRGRQEQQQLEGGALLDFGEQGEEDGAGAGAATRAAAVASPPPTAALLPPTAAATAASDAAAVENGPTVEPVDPELRRQVAEGRSLSLRGLRKVYQTTSGPRVAVDGLTLDLYEGQCSVLLGHNGAGKSTTIAMLTGLVPPTAGEAWVRGRRLTREMGAIRRSLGLCPQHDTLWPELTVTEHLELFGTLKGVARAELAGEVRRWVEEVGLGDKANVESARLSGGMKRKLCLAMALIGGSKVVFLDEPTSGMDPYSRRQIWNVLERNKHGRILLLTTHFMDEADTLGDRIAIMVPNPGRLRAVGSSLFLKGHYGVGYSLTIVKAEQTAPSQPIVTLVQSLVPDAEVTSEAGAELAFRLPFAASPAFPSLFRSLDRGMDTGELRVSTYGIAVTTLLEVFLRIGEESAAAGTAAAAAAARHGGSDDAAAAAIEDEKEKKANPAAVLPPLEAEGATTNSTSSSSSYKSATFSRHVGALVRKRYLYAVRDRKSQCCQLVLPALLVLLGLSLVKLLGNPLVQDELLLTPAMFNPDHGPRERNPLPVLATTPTAREVMARLSVDDEGGKGLLASYVDVATLDGGGGDDVFAGCAVGAPELLRMSNYLAATASDKGSQQQEQQQQQQQQQGGSGGAARYGALTFAGTTAGTKFVYNVLVNASALHGAGVYMNLASNAILRTLRPPAQEEGEPPLITTRNYPLPLTYEEQRASFLIEANTASTFVLIGMCFIPAAIAIFVVKEAESKAKHQQLLSGVGILAYWLSNFLWDLLSWLPPLLITLGLLYAFGIKTFTEGQAAGAFVLLFLAFAPAATAFTYMWTFCFASHSAAQTVTLFISFLTGLVLSITSIVLSLIDSTRAVSLKLRYVFRLLPAYCFGDGLLQLAFCVDDVCPKFTPDGVSITEPLSPLSWDVTTADIAFLLLEALVYFALTLLIERLRAEPWIAALIANRPAWCGFWRRGRPQPHHHHQQQPEGMADGSSSGNYYRPLAGGEDGGESGAEEDADVRAEAARMRGGGSRRGASGDVVRLEALRKVYLTPRGPKVAVRGLSFGIPRGECFGFLGVNGAGKTTTLSMLSGESPPTSGTAHIAGFSVTREQAQLRQRIGYCPQFSALIDALTVREHLELFARIKGVPEPRVPGRVRAKMGEMDLLDFADKAAGSLSGGNQRKLSVAIATISDPPVLFLDEPSTGMDPASRRFMWDVIAQVRARGSSIILTTHSMEEAEALCTRIGIMVDGRLKCLGTPQHLKSRFGEGWELDIRLHVPAPAAVDGLLWRLGLAAPDGAAASMSYADIAEACVALGHAGWEAEVGERGSGAVLWSVLQGSGSEGQSRGRGRSGSGVGEALAAPAGAGRVPARMVAEWLLAEEGAVALRAFLAQHFGNGVKLIERASWVSFRFSIPAASFGSLADLFEVLEKGKGALGVAEYSAGQAQIEVIFNRLCMQEEGEEAAAAAAAGGRVGADQ